MNDPWPHRRPAAFRLDDDRLAGNLAVPASDAAGRTVQVLPEPLPDLPAAPADAAFAAPRRGLRWGVAFWSATGSLVLLALGVAVASLVEDLFARGAELGWIGTALTAIACVSLLVVAAREASALLQLSTNEKLQQRAADIIARDDRVAGRDLTQRLLALTRRMPRLARARAGLETHLGAIIDGADMVRLAERELMTPLDQEARRLVSAAAKRVSVVTALSPRAAIDILFVFASAVGLVRQLSFLYGVRPGTLGLARLMRQTVSHLALTGGLAATDSLIQQLLGHGIAAKLSARLGEGVLNGLLTARLGLAAIEIIRPLPFAALPRPTLPDLMGELLRGRDQTGDEPPPPAGLDLTGGAVG